MMNREIKFRAFDTTLGKMMPAQTLEQLFKSDAHGVNWYQLKLMQYTGLKDSSNPPKEIYEGDIINFEGDIYPVSWNDEDARWWGISDLAMTYVLASGQISESEVIGNIYENKELLDE